MKIALLAATAAVWMGACSSDRPSDSGADADFGPDAGSDLDSGSEAGPDASLANINCEDGTTFDGITLIPLSGNALVRVENLVDLVDVWAAGDAGYPYPWGRVEGTGPVHFDIAPEPEPNGRCTMGVPPGHYVFTVSRGGQTARSEVDLMEDQYYAIVMMGNLEHFQSKFYTIDRTPPAAGKWRMNLLIGARNMNEGDKIDIYTWPQTREPFSNDTLVIKDAQRGDLIQKDFAPFGAFEYVAAGADPTGSSVEGNINDVPNFLDPSTYANQVFDGYLTCWKARDPACPVFGITGFFLYPTGAQPSL